MRTYIALIDFTPHGMAAIRETTSRAADLAARAGEVGAEVREVFWTSGPHDGALVFDAPDDEAASALMLMLGEKGNVKTTTLRAFRREEMERILSRLP